MTKLIQLNNPDKLKDYFVYTECKHFKEGFVAKGFYNEGEARIKSKELIIKQHCLNGKNPLIVKKECMRTCGVKMSLTQCEAKLNKDGIIEIKE